MNLALFALFFLQGKAILDRISSKSLYFFLLYLGWASFLLVYAIVLGNEFTNSIRFFIIITLIQLAFLVKTSKGYVDVLIIW
jgi:magnesium-transporting ATPase (P-type)